MKFLESLWQDLRYGVRVLGGNLRFTTAAVAALVLGIGVNTTVFSAYKAMVARSVDVRGDARNRGEMVNIALGYPTGTATFTFSYADYESYRDAVRAFRDVIAFTSERLTLSDAGSANDQTSSNSLIGRLGLLRPSATNAEFASVFAVSDNYLQTLGVTPVRGRLFDAHDALAHEGAPAVLVSEDYWQRRFAGDPAPLNRIVRLNGATVTIVGITPKGFVGTNVAAPDFWVPMALEPIVHADDAWLSDREHAFCRIFARLSPGATIDRARAEMSSVVDRVRALHDPNSDAAKPAAALVWPGSPFPLPLNQYAGLTVTIALIMAAAVMVLVVACANVASLQLARAGARQTELRTRASLGATRWRVIRQLLTESALLGLVAGTIALAFSWALLQVAATIAAEALPIDFGSLVFRVTPDLGIFGFALAISLGAAVLFGLAPAVDGSRSAFAAAARASTSPRHTRRLQNGLVAAQVALSLVLIIAGSTLIHGARQSLSRDAGYDAAHVIDLEVRFPEALRYSTQRKAALIDDLRTRAAALPGVTTVTSAQPPDVNFLRTVAVSLDGGAGAPDRVASTLSYTYVEQNYFQTMGIPLVLGRGFQDVEREPAVVLSESAARQLWRDRNPVGRRVRLGVTDEQIRNRVNPLADGASYDVIGIARDIRGVAFDGSDSREIYLVLPEDKRQGRGMLIRAQGNVAALLKQLGPMVSSVDPDLLATSSTLQDRLHVSAPFVISSFSAAVASSLGVLGLLLAAMGIYGTVSYIVVRRTREVGIRMAIGAQNRDILGLVLGESARPVVLGLAAGLVVAAVGSHFLDGVFYGLGTLDPISLSGVTVLFLAMTVLAAYPPALRASRVDPIVALRTE